MLRAKAWRSAGVAQCLGCMLAAPVASQDTARPEMRNVAAEEFGSAATLTIIPLARFHGRTSADDFALAANSLYYKAASGSGTVFLVAPLELPVGAEVVEFCSFWRDTDSSGNGGFDGAAEISALELPENNTDGPPTAQSYAVTGVVNLTAPGYTKSCASTSFTVRAIADIGVPDGFARPTAYSIAVLINQPVGGGEISFGGASVSWRRQVAPDPGVATFTDVPLAHPQHRWVEALAAAGVTAGCGGGNFCPDGPVTRGQLAVFLAEALGLHWPY